jgi:hypothetical protein
MKMPGLALYLQRAAWEKMGKEGVVINGQVSMPWIRIPAMRFEWTCQWSYVAPQRRETRDPRRTAASKYKKHHTNAAKPQPKLHTTALRDTLQPYMTNMQHGRQRAMQPYAAGRSLPAGPKNNCKRACCLQDSRQRMRRAGLRAT